MSRTWHAPVPCLALLSLLSVCVGAPQGEAVVSCEANFDSVSLVQLKAPLSRSVTGKTRQKSPAEFQSLQDTDTGMDTLEDIIADVSQLDSDMVDSGTGASGPPPPPPSPHSVSVIIDPGTTTASPVVAAAATAPAVQTAAAPPRDSKTISVIIPDQATLAPTATTTGTERIEISVDFPTTTTTTAMATSTLKYQLSLDIQSPTPTTTLAPFTTRTMIVNIILDQYTTTKPSMKTLMKAQATQVAKGKKMITAAKAQAKKILAKAKTPAAKKEAQKILARAKIAATPKPVAAPYNPPVATARGRSGILTSSTAPPPSPSMATTTANLAQPCVKEKGGMFPPAPPPYLSPVAVNVNGTYLNPLASVEDQRREDLGAPPPTWKERQEHAVNAGVATTPPPTMMPLRNPSKVELAKLNASRFQATLDCQLSPWGDWSECEVVAGMAEQFAIRKRSIVNPQQKGGRACTDPFEDQRACENT